MLEVADYVVVSFAKKLGEVGGVHELSRYQHCVVHLFILLLYYTSAKAIRGFVDTKVEIDSRQIDIERGDRDGCRWVGVS